MKISYFIISLFCFLIYTNCLYIDNNTFSNFNDVRLDHFYIYWDIQVDKQLIVAKVDLNFTAMESIDKVSLDVWNLVFSGEADQCLFSDEQGKTHVKVTCSVVQHSPDFGDELVVKVFDIYGKNLTQNETFMITINYTITNASIGLQFLKPEQTTSQAQPFFYAYSKQIYARTLIPLMDTPAIKQIWQADIRVPANTFRNVFMSAELYSREEHDDYVFLQFKQINPVPSYLFAIVGGNLVQKQIRKYAFVVAEPDQIDSFDLQLEQIENYLEQIENYFSIPFQWGQYNVIIMPPAFPLGSVENPILTFMSADILNAGNFLPLKDLVHSWIGNIVCVENWQNLWLIEGWATYVARQIEQTYAYDYQTVKLQSWLGNISMSEDFNSLQKGQLLSFTTLQPNVTNINPDQGFSSIPSEKGYQFAVIIQKALGAEGLQEFLHEWVKNNHWESRNSSYFQDFFVGWVVATYFKPQFILQQINFDKWFNQVNLPPNQDILKQQFSIPQVTDPIHEMAEQFIEYAGYAVPEGWEQVKQYSNQQIYIFLQHLYSHRDRIQKIQSNVKIMYLLDSLYQFSSSKNQQVLARWFRTCIFTNYQLAINDKINMYLKTQGRVRNIIMIYQAFIDNQMKDSAESLFNEYQFNYHPAARIAIKKIVYPTQQQ